MGFKDWLQDEMDARGLDPSKLARTSKVPQPTIFRILSGETKDPRTGTVKKLERALGSESPPLEATAAPVLAPEDAALLDDLLELLPEDATRYRAAIRAEADKARRYRGKPTAARLLSAPPAGETVDLIKKKDTA